MHPYSSWAFQWYQKRDKMYLGLGDLNVTNNPHSFIYIDEMPFMLFFYYHISMETLTPLSYYHVVKILRDFLHQPRNHKHINKTSWFKLKILEKEKHLVPL